MENIQIEKSESKGINMNQIQNNRPDMRVSINKMNTEQRIGSPNENPRLVDVPSIGIELLENRSRKRENSMDISQSYEVGSSENDMYDMPMEDFNDIQRKIAGENAKPNLFEFIQKKDSRDSRSRSRDYRRGDDRPLRNFAPVRESLRPNLGKETLDDMVYASADISKDRSLGQEMGYSMEDFDRKLDGEGSFDPYEKAAQSRDDSRRKDYSDEKTKENKDDLDDMNIDDLLSECATLKEKHGINVPEHFNRRTPTDEVRAFIRRERKKREKGNAEKMAAKILLTTVTALEWLNTKFDPFDLKLDGWSESVHENIDDYHEVFGELWEKYRTSTKVPPEVKLIMMLGGSAAMVHLTNTMFKSSLPGMEDMLKQNPEMMKQFAQAAQSQMGSGPAQPPSEPFRSAPNPFTMPQQPPIFNNTQKSGPPPPVDTRPPPKSSGAEPQMRGPSMNAADLLRMPPLMRPNQPPAGPMRPVPPPMTTGTGLPAMNNQQPRREMRGPAGVDNILKELQATKPPSPNKKSPSGSLISKGPNNKRSINISLN